MEQHIPKLDGGLPVGYVVSVWPRLSETFILNEVIALERQGIQLRIFSIKNTPEGPVHAKVSEVRAPVTCLAAERDWWKALRPSVRLIRRHPVGYWQTLFQAWRYRRWGTGRRFIQAVCLADRLCREPVAHLHAHFAHAPALVAMFAHGLTGIPYSFTAHAKDIYVKTPAELLRAEIGRAHAVVTCTQYNRQYLLSRYPSECNGKLQCIYHGLDLPEFAFTWPRAPEPGAPVILSVARLVEKKGLSDVIEAAAVMLRRGGTLRVKIIGEGPLRPVLETQIKKLSLEHQVELLGAQPLETVRLAYRKASVFALPCTVAPDGDRDGIPNVLVEAMASGLPVVSTSVSGIPELIESDRTGLLVPPGRPDLLADAIERLLGQPHLGERLARAARAKIEVCFSMDRSSSELLAVFRSCSLFQPSGVSAEIGSVV